MIKVRATGTFVVIELPEDRTLAPKHVVVVLYDLCFIVFYTVHLLAR
jgi:hypothetical protein